MSGTLGETSADERVNDALIRYAALLRASPHNLLSRRGIEELEVRHLPEAVTFSRSLPRGPRLLDIGSGGGLPGIVVAIVRPELEVHLLEATGKKAAFLASTAEELGIRVQVHHGRAEELASPPLSDSFDLVTARAVAPLERLVPWAAPFLRRGGQLLAIKGDRWRTELDAAGPAIRRAGLRIRSTPDAASGERVQGAPLVVVLERAR